MTDDDHRDRYECPLGRVHPGFALWRFAQGALKARDRAGRLVICDVVYAELAPHFEGDRLDTFLEEAGIRDRLLTRAPRVYRTYFPDLTIFDPSTLRVVR